MVYVNREGSPRPLPRWLRGKPCRGQLGAACLRPGQTCAIQRYLFKHRSAPCRRSQLLIFKNSNYTRQTDGCQSATGSFCETSRRRSTTDLSSSSLSPMCHSPHPPYAPPPPLYTSSAVYYSPFHELFRALLLLS